MIRSRKETYFSLRFFQTRQSYLQLLLHSCPVAWSFASLSKIQDKGNSCVNTRQDGFDFLVLFYVDVSATWVRAAAGLSVKFFKSFSFRQLTEVSPFPPMWREHSKQSGNGSQSPLTHEFGYRCAIWALHKHLWWPWIRSPWWERLWVVATSLGASLNENSSSR